MPAVVGEIYKPESGYPTATQPAGPGTATTFGGNPNRYIDPTYRPEWQLQPEEKQGLFAPGCGHAINFWRIFKDTVGGIAVAVVCCPYCLFTQKIISPYEDVLNTEKFPIITG
jgi:hypothetical protein